ncbi:MAG: DUF4382 domain-containing protein [Terracidiphilus sp.]
MCKRLSIALLCSALLSVLASCGSDSPVHSIPATGSAPVTLTMTDDPPAGVSVLFFQVSLTSATLTPAAGMASTAPVSLIENPVQVDVTQLQALSALLANESVPGGNYSSLNLTFADPQLVILNTSDTSLGSACAVGSVCTLTPSLGSSANISYSSTPFPIGVTNQSPLGLLIDFHLNTIIQSDLSVNLGVANGIAVSQLPSVSATAAPPFGFVVGTVETVNASQGQVTIQTAWGKTLTIDVNSNTQFIDWPPCVSPGGLYCLTAGDAVEVQVASVNSDGSLEAAAVGWLLENNAQNVQGTVIGYSATGIKLLVLVTPLGPAAANVPPQGSIANVKLDSGAAFAVDAGGFTIPSGFVFSSTENLTQGQQLQVEVDPGSLSCAASNVIPGPPPSCTFTTNSVQLEPSQISGTIASISSPDFTLDYEWSPCTPPGGNPTCQVIALIQYNVETTSQTTYEGFNPDNFSGLADNDLVSVNGWLFEADNGLLDPAVVPPEILAQDVRLHPGATF